MSGKISPRKLQVSTGEYVHRDLGRDSFDNFYAFTHHALCFLGCLCMCVCACLSTSMHLSVHQFVNTTFHEPVGVISPNLQLCALWGNDELIRLLGVHKIKRQGHDWTNMVKKDGGIEFCLFFVF